MCLVVFTAPSRNTSDVSFGWCLFLIVVRFIERFLSLHLKHPYGCADMSSREFKSMVQCFCTFGRVWITLVFFSSNWHFLCFWETSDKNYIHLQTANKERGDYVQQRSIGKAEVFTEFYFLLCLSYSRSICWISKCTYYCFMCPWFLNSTYSYNIHRFHF